MPEVLDLHQQFRRVQRAEEMAGLLSDEIQRWVATGPMDTVGQIAEDRLGWTLSLRVLSEPPLDDWGLRFGEAAHHLRAALDNSVVAIGQYAGLTQEQRRRLAFPIAGSAGEWREARSRIRELPPAYADAIEKIQPFQREGNGERVGSDPLILLRDVDNSDKHHLQVTSGLQPETLQHLPMVEFETEEGAAASVPPDIEIFGVAFTDGEILLRQQTKGRIARISGRYSLTAQVVANLPGDRTLGVTEALQICATYCRTIFEYLACIK